MDLIDKKVRLKETTPYDETFGLAVGATGVVVSKSASCWLVKFDGFTNGHNAANKYDDNSYWYVDTDRLEVIDE